MPQRQQTVYGPYTDSDAARENLAAVVRNFADAILAKEAEQCRFENVECKYMPYDEKAYPIDPVDQYESLEFNGCTQQLFYVPYPDVGARMVFCVCQIAQIP